MKKDEYKLTDEERAIIAQMCDLTLKTHGIASVNKVYAIMKALDIKLDK